MLAYLILGIAALMAAMFTGGFLLVVIGIRRADRGKRLYGKPADSTEALARRLLTTSRGCSSSGDKESAR
jgi:hypothetical protein